jgi:hypothetical protein
MKKRDHSLYQSKYKDKNGTYKCISVNRPLSSKPNHTHNQNNGTLGNALISKNR